MTISLGSLEVGRCYLVPTEGGIQVWRVTEFLPDNRLAYEVRNGSTDPAHPWSRQGTTLVTWFAHRAEHEVPCDWVPELNEPGG